MGRSGGLRVGAQSRCDDLWVGTRQRTEAGVCLGLRRQRVARLGVRADGVAPLGAREDAQV